MYCDVWDASLGETLECEREPTNEKDRYAVVVKKSGTIVGRAKKISPTSLVPRPTFFAGGNKSLFHGE